MSAPHLTPRDPHNTIDGFAEVVRRLINDFGANIKWGSLPDDVGEWDGDARAITIDVDSPMQDQVCFLISCWKLCALGPHAVPELIDCGGRPNLRAVT